MVERFQNDVRGTLGAVALTGATSLTLSAGQGSLLPEIVAPDTIELTLERGPAAAPTLRERVTCTAHTPGSLTLTISALANDWAVGDKVEMRVTAGILERLRDGTSDVADDVADLDAALDSLTTIVTNITNVIGNPPAYGTPSVTVRSEATAASAGSGTAIMRANAQIQALTAAPTVAAVSEATAAAQGSASSLLRSDARIQVATAAPSTLVLAGSNTQGSSSSLARADHLHAFPSELTGNLEIPSIPRISPLYTGDATTGVLTDNATHALYLGRATRAYSAPIIHFYVPAGGLSPYTWGEVALATGTPNYGNGVNLTTQFWQSFDGVITANGPYSITLTNVPGAIARGDHVWLLIGCNDTARPNIGQGAGAVRAHGLILLATTTRPSTMAANTAFAISTIAPFALFLTEG